MTSPSPAPAPRNRPPFRPSSFVLAAVGAAVILAPAIALLSGLAVPSGAPPLYPHGDHAVLEIYTRLAASGDQRLGPYSRFHFHHPGPALFYLSLPVYELAGESHEGLKLAALLLNALSVTGLLWAARRLGGLAAYLATALGLAPFVAWWWPAGFFSNWNPTIAVLPFGLGLLAWGAVAAGRPAFLPVAVLASSFAVQAHVGCTPVTAAVAATALAVATIPSLSRALRVPLPAPGAWLRPLVIAAVVLAALWALPLAEQLDPEGGNLGRILEVARQRPHRHPSLPEAAQALAENAAAFLMGAAGSPETSRWLFPLLVVALVASLGLAWRARSAAGVALPLVTLVGMAAAVYSTTRIPGWAQPYLVGWMSMLGLAAFVGSAVGLGASPLLQRPAVARLSAAAALGITLALSALGLRDVRAQLRQPPDPPGPLSEWIRHLAESAAPALRASGGRRTLVEVERFVPRAVAVGLILGLDKAGVSMAVSPFGPFRFEGRLAPDGTEDATLRVGAESSGWTDQKGARMLASEGGVFLYLLPRRPTDPP